MITVTIDLRDLDPNTGPVPVRAKVTFALLNSTEQGGVLISKRPVSVSLVGGHGTVQLQPDTAYRVGCYQMPGFPEQFAVMTGASATTLGALWRSSQIDPNSFAARPIPQSVAEALAAIDGRVDNLEASGGSDSGAPDLTLIFENGLI